MRTGIMFLVFWIGKGIAYKVPNFDHFNEFMQSRKLREAGFNDFEVSHFREERFGDSTVLETDVIKRRKRSSALENVLLTIEMFDEKFEMKLQHATSVLHPRATVVTTTGETEEEVEEEHPDCFLTGEVTSHGGTVSMSYCNEMMGIHVENPNHLIFLARICSAYGVLQLNNGAITTKDHEYHIETLPRNLQKRDADGKMYHNVLISRRTVQNALQGIDYIYQNDGIKIHHRHKRYVPPSTSFTIELAVFTDAEFTKILDKSDRSKRIESIVTKYNGVQMEWARSDDLGYNVTLVIKYMNFMETDPNWYNASSTLSVGLKHVCDYTSSTSYDHVFIHTGVANPSPQGLAYQSKMCQSGYKCAISSSLSVVTYIATAHEIGHNMGMYHDSDQGCTTPNIGVMGGYGAGWSTCNKADMETFIATGNAACLWSTDVAAADVDSDLKSISLDGKLIGQIYTIDEVCEKMYETGYRFREYPQINAYDRCDELAEDAYSFWTPDVSSYVLAACAQYSCIDMKRGNTFGKMTKETESINGQYCGEGKICFKNECKTWADAKQDNLTIQEGGWSAWGNWNGCTRTCGNGVNFRRRICNNPRPFNHETCSGEEYDAELCNESPCPSDSSDESTLKTTRASETCATLVANGVIDSTNYKTTGTVYNDIKMGKCEVQCDAQDGYTTPTYTRFGLMPDGSPCNSDEMTEWDSDNWPRRPGYNDHCLEGYCQIFGCDKKLKGKTYDGCGVCGGDNSSCTVVSGKYMGTINQNDRFKVWEIPTGAYNIQFWYTYSNMKKIFLELYDKDGLVIMATNVYASQVSDSRTNPISFGGAFWYYFYNYQFLYAKGPLTAPAFIYVFNRGSNPNLGINYAYSVPANMSSCSGTCQNSGVWNNATCACDCPSGKYGADCSSSCNKYCWNGGTVDENDCSCKCTDYSYDSKCKTCKAVFTGPDCKTCKYSTCLNCGVFNSSTCRCDCLDGYGGVQCEGTCGNSLSTCETDATAGKCESDNVQMEANCPLACGFCVAKSPATYCNTSVTTTTTTTTTTASPSCGSNQHQCSVSKACIAENLKCDNISHCSDSSDETHEDCFSNSSNSVYVTSFPVFSILLLFHICFRRTF